MIVHRKPTASGNFTQVANSVLIDKNLSLKARGLMAFLLSRAPGWKLHIKGLVASVKHDGRDSVSGAFGELVRFGYVVRKKQRAPGGRILAPEYEVFEEPVGGEQPQAALPDTGKPDAVNPAPVKPPLCNTEANKIESIKNRIDMEGQSSSILLKEESVAVPAPTFASETDLVGGFPLKDYAARTDAAMTQNLALASSRYWGSLKGDVAKNRSFADVFGSQPRIAWTSAEYGFLREIAAFCATQWSAADARTMTAALIRQAFRRTGKAHQFLKYWAVHARGKITLRPFLSLGGGAQDPAKRLDVLRELAVAVEVPTLQEPPSRGADLTACVPAGESPSGPASPVLRDAEDETATSRPEKLNKGDTL